MNIPWRTILCILVLPILAICDIHSQEDSILYLADQVRNRTDVLSYQPALEKLRNTPIDSLDIRRMEEKLKTRIPNHEMYLAFKSNLAYKLSRGTEYTKAIEYNKKLIEELIQYKSPFYRSLLYDVIAFNRIPNRNSSHILDGISYYLQMANVYEEKNDSNVVSLLLCIGRHLPDLGIDRQSHLF